MRTSHLLTIGAAAALATGANAAILVMDHFTTPEYFFILNPAGPPPAVQVNAPLPTGIGTFGRQATLTMQSWDTAGERLLEWQVGGSVGNYRSSDSANGKLTIDLATFSGGNLVPMNLDRSMYPLAGAIGVYLEGWNTTEAQVPLTVTIWSSLAGATPAAGDPYYQYTYNLPLGSLASLIIDGNLFSSSAGVFNLADVDWVRFEFDPVKGGDFRVDALGIPEPRDYAVVAGLGLLGFAAFRRLQRRS